MTAIPDIRITNLKEDMRKCPTFRIDRSTPLGNMFRITPESNRTTIIKLYESQFQDILDIKPEALQYVNEIIEAAKRGPINLACWCSPRPCHGEVIKRYVLSKLKETS